jgi:DNA-binding MarR family transcriptional regulator
MQHANSISFLIQNIATLLLRQSDQVLQEQLGIGMSQFRILKIVQANPRMLQRHIADALGQTEASISRQVRVLHDKQLLKTVINPRNRREHITSLTPRGFQITEAALEVLQNAQAPLVDGFSEKQQLELMHTLDTLKHHIFLTAGLDRDY